MTKEERTELIHELTSNAGKARLISMSAKDRSRVAKLGAEARWKLYRANKRKEATPQAAPAAKKGKK